MALEKLTKEQKEKMYYRQILLNDKLLKLGDLINGRSSSFHPFIMDKSGKASDERINGFISSLLDCLSDYSDVSGGNAIDADTAEMYRAFLYCAATGMKCAVNRRCPSAANISASQTFADIIEFAEYLEPSDCNTYEDFLKLEYSAYRNNAGPQSYFFDCIDESLRMLGYTFIKGLPNDVQIKLCREYAAEHNIPEEDNSFYLKEASGAFESDDFLKWENEQAESEKENGRDIERQIDEELELLIKEDKKDERAFDAIDSLNENEFYKDNDLLRKYTVNTLKELEAKKTERKILDEAEYIRKNIVNTQTFIESYDKFTKLYFTIDHGNMSRDIKNMVDTFLFENKLSSFAFGSGYGLITYQIYRMESRIMLEIERGKRK